MNDLISRQAAIEALGEKPEGNDEWSCGCRNQWEWDTEILKTMPSAQPGWIPCSVKLPTLGIRYTVTYESGEVGYADFRNKVIYGDKCVKNVWDIPEYYEDDGQVVAWMPLPAPYIPEGDDKHEG